MLNNRNTAHGNQDMIAFAAGVFDADGSVNYAQYKCNKPNGKMYMKWNVSM